MSTEQPNGISPVELYLESLKKGDTEAIAKAAAEIAKEAGISEDDPNFVNQLTKAKTKDSLGEDDIVIPGLEINLKNADFADLLEQFKLAEKLVGKLGIKKLEKITFHGWQGQVYAVILYPDNFVSVGLYIDPDKSFLSPYFHMMDVGKPFMPEDRIMENKKKVAQYFTKVTLPRIPKHK